MKNYYLFKKWGDEVGNLFKTGCILSIRKKVRLNKIENPTLKKSYIRCGISSLNAIFSALERIFIAPLSIISLANKSPKL